MLFSIYKRAHDTCGNYDDTFIGNIEFVSEEALKNALKVHGFNEVIIQKGNPVVTLSTIRRRLAKC